MPGCDGIRILTDYVDVISTDATTPLWNPRILPRLLDTTHLREVRLSFYLSGNSGLQVRGGADFSENGVTYPAAPKEFTTAWSAVVGWNYGAWTDVWALTGVTRQLYARIGVQVLNLAGSRTESAQLRMLLEGKPFWSEVRHRRGAQVRGPAGVGDAVSRAPAHRGVLDHRSKEAGHPPDARFAECGVWLPVVNTYLWGAFHRLALDPEAAPCCATYRNPAYWFWSSRSLLLSGYASAGSKDICRFTQEVGSGRDVVLLPQHVPDPFGGCPSGRFVDGRLVPIGDEVTIFPFLER